MMFREQPHTLERVMKPAESVFSTWAFYVLFSISASLITLAIISGNLHSKEKMAEISPEAKKVNNILNRNKQPTLVDRRAGSPRRVAVFPETYDWKEEARVLDAIDQLYADTTPELWEELLRRGKDSSYSVVLVEEKKGDARIATVGSICSRLAYSRLVRVFEQHVPPNSGLEGRPVFLEAGIGNLVKWRNERKNKLLYELQIEVAKNAIHELSTLTEFPKEQLARAQKKIEAEVEKLRKLKKPAFFTVRFAHELTYTSKVAKVIREAVRDDSSDDIDVMR